MIDKKHLRKLAELSTQTEWYPHRSADCYGPEPTVRGPFFRWFKCTAVQPEDQHHVADAGDDVYFAAAAMNNLIPLLDEIEQLEKELSFAREVAVQRGKTLERLEIKNMGMKALLLAIKDSASGVYLRDDHYDRLRAFLGEDKE